MNGMSDEFYHQLMHDFVKFRQDLRQILYENGVMSNPGWTEDDVVNAFRQLLRLKEAALALKDAEYARSQIPATGFHGGID